MRIIVNHCVANDKFIRSTSLHWLNELLNLGKEILLSDTYLILDTLFQRMNDVDEISNLALETHQMLLDIVYYILYYISLTLFHFFSFYLFIFLIIFFFLLLFNFSFTFSFFFFHISFSLSSYYYIYLN